MEAQYFRKHTKCTNENVILFAQALRACATDDSRALCYIYPKTYLLQALQAPYCNSLTYTFLTDSMLTWRQKAVTINHGTHGTGGTDRTAEYCELSCHVIV